MIYLFCGDDAKNKHNGYDIFLKSISGDMEVFFIGKNNFESMTVESFYSGAGLFFAKCIVVFTNIFEREDILSFVLSKLDLMSESNNDFVFLESKLSKPILDVFKKNKAEINIFELSKEKKEKYNNFLLAYDFEKRDKLNLWIHFRQAINVGVGMEELVGILFWKAKDMILKKDFKKFSERELVEFISKISYLLPEARKEAKDAESVFEQFLLEAF
ncbi:MAG: hypothetical protein UR25_C0003G0136 [Candidatus Nomurabacteria bacterium GW2011_GWE1_32_28]|uniref:DNA polymerase III delta N-terminal domain-containing protein n=1 Tax=Candidatus Nomurabacteria bacterium GW2011_GWF1_31_48 TaxID=1618767 RepID=A0A0F9YG03_9BACT|nr:MAG: hypothetical protein UR10_C0003G0135 [Candidatus Nomurabacteria bacterium GW2011_GWF2_30_133]KKP28775.1 MAG: hypothetical protein UR18_C0002G0187 [Candidatus Nomurabacteria bacterium GW2011_GWE2_31_40]KKP30353.1 MAG: hypothetical protein UR19_C0003G0189 [Candidatus Nomurabacteria bacterium GW2011_GWF1_31_48]KKP34880.1 MAG: hypothetical protein UR25_C0003G0136 [Candidatus Nomurabacteria bacterium GW2011_GWE1_32_28]HAS80971.1 hypothetical protein [Candidatus Nomurabacteria bacterium]